MAQQILIVLLILAIPTEVWLCKKLWRKIHGNELGINYYKNTKKWQK